MPNPNRPNTGEAIPAEWGRLVADRVIRRFRSRAERDIDFAGVGDTTGQLVVIAPPGAAPWFEQNDGTGWRRTGGGPLIGGELVNVGGGNPPPYDGASFPTAVGWLSGGMDAYGLDWAFPGDRRVLVVPLPGLYRAAGHLVAFNHGFGAQYWYADVSRVLVGGSGINAPALRLTRVLGGNPNMLEAWMRSAFSGLVACLAGDGVMVTARFGPANGNSIEEVAFSLTFEADLPPGYVVPPVPQGLDLEEVDWPESLPINPAPPPPGSGDGPPYDGPPTSLPPRD